MIRLGDYGSSATHTEEIVDQLDLLVDCEWLLGEVGEEAGKVVLAGRGCGTGQQTPRDHRVMARWLLAHRQRPCTRRRTLDRSHVSSIVKCSAPSDLDEGTIRTQQRPNSTRLATPEHREHREHPEPASAPAPRSPLEIPCNRIRRLLSQILEEPREIESRFPTWCGSLSRC
jgi:hypothetical protein